MGMDAEIIAIGKFSKNLAKYLDYPVEYYNDTPEDSEISTVIHSCNTTDESKYLAEALGIDPWKFEQHVITSDKIDMKKISDFADDYVGEELVEAFKAFKEANFKFYFMPNG